MIRHGDPIPSGYRQARTNDVRSNMDQVKPLMIEWMIAELVDGEVLGKSLKNRASLAFLIT